MTFPSTLSIFAGFCLSLIIAYIAYYFRFLSKSGAIAALLVGAIVFGLGGLAHTAVLLSFFFSSSILSVILKKQKQKVNEKYAKGSRRDAGQVLANGGVATLCVVVGVIFPDQPVFWWMFCAAFAAANADTWATEIGVFSKFPPRLITSFKQVEAGTSGGITLLGSVSALAGASLIAGIAGFLSNRDDCAVANCSRWIFRFISRLIIGSNRAGDLLLWSLSKGNGKASAAYLRWTNNSYKRMELVE